jgi:hypothetical protein
MHMGGNTDEFFTLVYGNLGGEGSALATRPAPPAESLAFGNSWARCENTRANNNPIASGWITGGSTAFNNSGVQNYSTPEMGAQATAANLRGHPQYAPIISAFLSGTGFYDADVIAGVGFWGTGDFVAELQANAPLTDDFVTEALPSAVPTPSDPPPSPSGPPAPYYTITAPQPGYTNSDEAASMTGSNSTVEPGTYEVQNKNIGMVALYQSNGAPGWWVNPAQGGHPATAPPEPEPAPAPPPPPPVDEYTVTAAQPGYVTSADAASKRNSNSTVPPGTYRVQNRNIGMVALYQLDGVPGWWINPAQ